MTIGSGTAQCPLPPGHAVVCTPCGAWGTVTRSLTLHGPRGLFSRYGQDRTHFTAACARNTHNPTPVGACAWGLTVPLRVTGRANGATHPPLAATRARPVNEEGPPFGGPSNLASRSVARYCPQRDVENSERSLADRAVGHGRTFFRHRVRARLIIGDTTVRRAGRPDPSPSDLFKFGAGMVRRESLRQPWVKAHETPAPIHAMTAHGQDGCEAQGRGGSGLRPNAPQERISDDENG